MSVTLASTRARRIHAFIIILAALNLPLIPLEDGVALLPLVGYLDDARAGQLVAGMLRGIYEEGARAVVLDITGLRAVDARAAAALLRAARGARLLGTQVVLSGVSPRAAEALVDLGANLRGLRTAASLGDALTLIGRRNGNECESIVHRPWSVAPSSERTTDNGQRTTDNGR
jgi:rsbT co-antagonist protein RsbR